MEKFVPCRKCKKKAGSSLPEGYYLGDNGLAVECKHHIVWKKAAELERKMLKRGFSKDALNWTPESYKGTKSRDDFERLLKYASLFSTDKVNDAKKCFIYIYGPNGTQKTSVAQGIGKTINESGVDCRYILMKSLIDNLWKSQRDDEIEEEIRELANCDVLILDEAFSKDKIHIWASGNQLGYIDEFLRERINNGKGCIFISNNLPTEIENQGFSHSLQDLVTREIKKQNALLTFVDNYFDSISEEEIPESLF